VNCECQRYGSFAAQCQAGYEAFGFNTIPVANSDVNAGGPERLFDGQKAIARPLLASPTGVEVQRIKRRPATVAISLLNMHPFGVILFMRTD
jgi:hypothetical protein